MTTTTRTAVSGLILLSVAAVSAPAQERLPRFSAEDVFALEYADDPRISPDGERIVYERHSNDIMTDSTRSNLWLVDVDGDDHRPLVSGPAQATSPRWAPDGERIAWFETTTSGDTSRSTSHVRWLASGATAEITELLESADDLAWSPDGRWLAFSMSVKAESEPLAKPRSAPEGAQWSEPVKLFDAVRYKRDGAGFVEEAYQQLFVVPADGGAPRQVTSGDYDHAGPYAWSPDGERIYFSANRDDDWEYEPVESDIWAVSVVDGALEQITDRPGGESAPVVSPDGRRLAYAYDDGRKVAYRNRILHVADTDGSNDRAVTADLDASVDNVQWAGRSLYFQYVDQGRTVVGRATLDGSIDVVTDRLGGTTTGRPYLSGTFTVSSGGTVVYTHGSADRLADVAVAARGGPRLLTSLNDELLGQRALGQVQEIRYASSHDGTEIQGWYITPPGYESGQAYPTILEIHGGPHLAYGPQFSAELQRYAADGYVVFYDNHRGSTGYGADFALKLQYLYSSEADFADHMSGLDALIERGIADPEQLFITGGSAGGIASAYAIGLTDRFVAAAVQKPVINWVSKVLTADSYLYQIPFQFPGMPWEEHEHYWQRSPLSLVGNVSTPTLLITGEEDQRTPISETEQFYQALKLLRVDTAMVRVPGASHGIAGRPSRLNAKVDNILAWFARYRDGETANAD
ncbi:MAG: S9 family peptidase [Woeseiaceae bacterium]|nr:S9 family peptidase [Woeseiaceae bacterium]